MNYACEHIFMTNIRYVFRTDGFTMMVYIYITPDPYLHFFRCHLNELYFN